FLFLGNPVLAHAALGAQRSFSQDLVSAGSNISLGPNDSVGRDVVCFGCSVDINGAQVGRDVVAFGGSVTINNGRVGRAVFAPGGNVTLHGNAFVGRDANTEGCKCSITGRRQGS